MASSLGSVGAGAKNVTHRARRLAVSSKRAGKRQVSEVAKKGSGLAKDAGSRASQSAKRLGKSIGTFAKKRPIATLLVSAGAGALLIGAVRRRKAT